MVFLRFGIGLCALLLMSCNQSGQDRTESSPSSLSSLKPTQQTGDVSIHLNQLGFLPHESKIAVVVGLGNKPFKIMDSNDQTVMQGTLTKLAKWGPSGEQASSADFSAVTASGQYHLQLDSGQRSMTFTIGPDVYKDVARASLKAFYYARASTALDSAYAGQYARPKGHPDDHVEIHSSAASAGRPAGSFISAAKGWYDAGDYGKYVVNSGISTFTLLYAYQQFSGYFQQQNSRIPESNDNVPDILNEVKWNLDWLQAMQDPSDGGVYHKLTTLQFAGMVMPADATAQRYVIQKTTAATLDFAAVMAQASRVYQPYEAQFPGLSAAYRQAAKHAWQWAEANPNVTYQQPSDVGTGAYGDKHLQDEFGWAAAELFLLTADDQYLQRFNQLALPLTVPSWGDVASLGYLSLLQDGKSMVSASQFQQWQQKLLAQANIITEQARQSAYKVAMKNNDFVWGSNAVALNKGLLLLSAYQQQPEPVYRKAAAGLLDYVLGRNPLAISYVTGFGSLSPMHIHHRPSEADGIVAPVPGFIAGGAQNGHQDGCRYDSDMPATSYLDSVCSYSTNEVAINWNAPLVYVLSGMQVLTK